MALQSITATADRRPPTRQDPHPARGAEVRHSQALTRLMDERDDLRGVHALADFVDDSLRWTA